MRENYDLLTLEEMKIPWRGGRMGWGEEAGGGGEGGMMIHLREGK